MMKPLHRVYNKKTENDDIGIVNMRKVRFENINWNSKSEKCSN